MTPISKCIPGQWYLVLACELCKTKHPIFPDLSKGKSELLGTYSWTCPSCKHRTQYEANDVERYQHLESVER
jgi:hypothetical protein